MVCPLPPNLESNSETSATCHPSTSSMRVLSSHASAAAPSRDGERMVMMGRASSSEGFCLPRQLQVGMSKELLAGKHGTAFSVSNESAKCLDYCNGGGRCPEGGRCPAQRHTTRPRQAQLSGASLPGRTCNNGAAESTKSGVQVDHEAIERSLQSYIFRTPAQRACYKSAVGQKRTDNAAVCRYLAGLPSRLEKPCVIEPTLRSGPI